MEKFTFPKVEYVIHNQLQDVTREALDNNLKEEVRLTVLGNDDQTYAGWFSSVLRGGDLESDEAQFVAISGSCDMGWQKRSSG